MPRKPGTVTKEPPVVINEAEVRKDIQALAIVTDNAQAVAEQLGYEGSLTVGALEDEIRFYQRRTAEACLEMGKRLLVLRELTPRDEFKQRVQLLGIEYTMATRFMSSALKFGKVASTQLLQAANSQTKLLEMLVLDDGEIEALEAGESARGITLDEIETMTVSELRAALRDAKEEKAATDRLIEDKNKKIDDLVKKGKRQPADPWPEEIAGIKGEIALIGSAADEALSKFLTFVDAVEKLADNAETGSDKFIAAKSVIHHLGAGVERLCHLAAGLREHYETRIAGYIADDKSHVLDAAA